jgi:hypothetical protein
MTMVVSPSGTVKPAKRVYQLGRTDLNSHISFLTDQLEIALNPIVEFLPAGWRNFFWKIV